MSSYSTCVLTNLPITFKTDVVVFLLEQRKNINWNRFNANTYFYPSLFPIYATYKDDGIPSNFHGLGHEIYLQELQKKAFLKDNHYHKAEKLGYDEKTSLPIHIPEILSTPVTMEAVFEAGRYGTLAINRRNETSIVIPVMMRRDAFESVLAKFANSSTECRERYEVYAKRIPDIVDELIALRENNFQTYGKRDFFAVDENIYEMQGGKKVVKGLEIIKFNIFMAGLDKNSVFGLYGWLHDIFVNVDPALHRSVLESHFLELLKGIWIDDFFSHIRKSWMPPVGECMIGEPLINYAVFRDLYQVSLTDLQQRDLD